MGPDYHMTRLTVITDCASTDSDQSLLCTEWVTKDLSFLHKDSEEFDQTG